ncbi:ubiquitin-like modifier-activating enzyme 7 isoform X5 [Suricata suricatta]|uniref:ubiquitin-like modifier-activating enzyme 7 isoform X5 n=1 Tax=Suricata suricatta TaxID=37032 RepID=UPI001155E319|nr:ubiquitin-like modifier-activating enzyme 7 isoform X5 [Suricata suricatta]
MTVPETSKLVDEELYSRQLYVLDLPAMQKIQGAKVLLSGLQGLGAEVAKNLVLMGVGSLTLHDPHPTCWSDLAAQFFLSEQDLERSRAEASQELVAKLNRAVQVCIHTGDITKELLLDFQVVVLTTSKLEEQLKVGTLCHKLGVCFLVADTRGLVGQLFCDFGEDFTVQDPTEAEPLTAAIQHISQGSPGILTLKTEAQNFCDVDLVTFSGIEGMVELNGCDPRPIHVRGKPTLSTTRLSTQAPIGGTHSLVLVLGDRFSLYLFQHGARSRTQMQDRIEYNELLRVRSHTDEAGSPLEDGTLEIGDTANFSCYLSGGIVTEVKRPKTVSHKPLDVALLQPHVVAGEAYHARCLHQAFRALHQFQHLHGRLPQPWDPVDAAMVVGLARSLEPLKGTGGEPLEEPLDEALVQTVALSSAGSLSPMAAIMGAVAAQEVLKAISGKFMPLDQWLYFDALDCLPEDGEHLPKPEDCAPVGAGAIGCELLKGFALVGLGAGTSGGVTVADMDHIERSNLSRQFLFSTVDIGRPKAEVAAEAARRLNSDLQVTALTYPLDPTTEHIYGNNFFSRVDGVAAALDSFQARHYVAARCTHYLKPLLEAGTQGTSGDASVFVPWVTETYRAPASALASENATYPVCTLRHFPSTVEHTVQWARDEFEGLFCLSAETINHHQQAPTSLAEPDGLKVLTLLQEALGVLRERPQTWQDCVVWALGHWQLCFHNSIIQLLNRFPPDKVLEDGTLFWSGSKQCPKPLEFDASQDTHLLYVLAAANLYAQMHGLPGSRDQTALRELLKSLLLPVPQHLAPIFPNDLELSRASAEFGPEQLKKLHKVLEVWSGSPPLKPLKFEKDNDSNFHVDFVAAAASLRAQNYGIPPANRAQSKRIVGQIIPAIATTTAAVAGLLGLELYKVVGGPRPLSAFRHSRLHLAENRFNRWVPCAPAIQKCHHLTWTWTCWDCLKVPAGQPERTLKSLLAHLQERYGMRVKMLLHGKALLYSAGWSPEKQAQHLALRVTKLVQQVTSQMIEPEQRVLVLELSCEGEEEDTTFPPLHYEL